MTHGLKRRLRAYFALAVLLTFTPALSEEAQAQTPAACEAPDYLTHVEGRLPAVAKSAAQNRISILVVGTGSSVLAGQTAGAYPARLEAAMKEALPNIAITSKVIARSRWSTAEMARELSALPAANKPDAVVWQTGTFEAMRNVDPDEFRYTLEKGVKKLQGMGIDVLLINMQYSPRTESMITAGPYAEAMRWVAQQHDVPLFDRLAVMKHWSESGVFDLTGPDLTHVAERVHDCIGRLLAQIMLDAAGLKRATLKETR